MVDEVEVDLERRASRVGHQRGRQSAGRDVEGDVPPVVGRWLVGESDLADDLRVELQRVAGVLPVSDRDRRPTVALRSRSSCAPSLGTRFVVHGFVPVDGSSKRRDASAASAIASSWLGVSRSTNSRRTAATCPGAAASISVAAPPGDGDERAAPVGVARLLLHQTRGRPCERRGGTVGSSPTRGRRRARTGASGRRGGR